MQRGKIKETKAKQYLDGRDVPAAQNSKARENQRLVTPDDSKNFSVGLQDIDEAIFYYFNNVIKPTAIQNGQLIEVPVIYGGQEQWASVQKGGDQRDKNGKIQAPIIMIKRDSIEKNRTLGNKLDANNPTNFGVFEKRYSQKNAYDRFEVLQNRTPVKEYQGVIMPDYVNITYSCIVMTNFMTHMNKILESVLYASDSYWGEENKFRFQAVIDQFQPAVELTQGEDRIVKTSFNIKLLGHVVPDTINAFIGNSSKFFSKSSVKFGTEVVKNISDVK
jgi:hypothetical protein